MYFKNKKTNYINMATIENKMRNDDDCLICFGNVNAKKTHICEHHIACHEISGLSAS